MVRIDRQKAGFIAALAVILLVALWSAFTIWHAMTPVRIGVLLPITGDIEAKEPLEWAQENINRGGGIGGRPVELVYKDTGTGETGVLAKELLDDGSIPVVIGPPTSADVYALTPAFAAQKKILISPYASAGDLSRAFAKNGYFWRTAQGDVAQVKIIMSILRGQGANRVALLVENTSYGKTFYDWAGFFAIESGITLTSIRQFEEGSGGLESDVVPALADNPDYIIAVCTAPDAARIKQAIDRSGKKTRLFVSDSAVAPDPTWGLGPAAEGIEGVAPTADPTSGFSDAYEIQFGHAPNDFAAPIYDTLLLAAYTEARQDRTWFESPADSLRAVVYGTGTTRGWDAQGIREALRDIRAGGSPSVTGASGPLRFDREYGVDPLVTYYRHWIVEKGDYRTISIVSSAKEGSSGVQGISVSHSRASPALMALPGNLTETYTPPQTRKDFQAVIIGPSHGWTNYRHQSDALAMYTMLRAGGVKDEHIILMLYDDIPTVPENPLKGDVHNAPKGSNLRPGAVVDYAGSQVTKDTLSSVLLGKRTEKTPVVLESNASTDVLVYIASHGMPGGIVFSDSKNTLTGADFSALSEAMSREGRYRQIVYIVDTCFGESVATNVSAKGLLYFTGSSAAEPSLGAVYDADIRQWLSDEFTATILNEMRDNPGITFRDLYIAAYERVTGSHVRMLNVENFGNIDIAVRDFVKP